MEEASREAPIAQIGGCRIVEEIGSGGMAVIYKATQEGLGRPVAVKVLKPSIAVDSQFAKRFEREAHFMAALQHENILHVYDFIKDGRTMSIIMEYVRGIDLYDLLERTPVLPIEIAAIISLQVARALDYAHFRGIIHRDIKPANVMISHQGTVKLMDFGIARDERLTDLTETGTGLGTPSYMSPEQILGDRIDFRSDVFSLGIVLYQMLTGRKPFVEDDAHTVMQKIRLDRYTAPRRLNPAVPRSLERILGRCMEKMPANRYPTTQALIDDLVEFLASRVPINHNARLVMYLRDVEVLEEAEANDILSAGAPRTMRRTTGSKQILRQMALVQGGLLLAAVFGGVVIQHAYGNFDENSRQGVATTAAGLKDAGYVRVVAEPWAEVYVDGEPLMTTPSARAIPLSPGVHYFKFKNPYYLEEDVSVQVRTGAVQDVKIEMTPRRSGAQEPAPSIPVLP